MTSTRSDEPAGDLAGGLGEEGAGDAEPCEKPCENYVDNVVPTGFENPVIKDWVSWKRP